MGLVKTEIKKELTGKGFRGRLLVDEPLARWTSWKIGGPCRCLAQPASPADLKLVLEFFAKEQILWRVLGGGTNILVDDSGLAEAVINLGLWPSKIEILPGGLVKIPAGLKLPRILIWLSQHGLTGLEFTAGVPASLGGALANNFGSFQQNLADLCQEIYYFDAGGRGLKLGREEINFGEHQSDLKSRKIILTQLVLRLSKTAPAQIREKIRSFSRQRRDQQPLNQPSAGCVFRNPAQGQPAGWLLEQAGLKGSAQGGAEVSRRHANFIVGRGPAGCRDVLLLMKKMVKEVDRKFRVRLEPEIELWSDELTWEQALA